MNIADFQAAHPGYALAIYVREDHVEVNAQHPYSTDGVFGGSNPQWTARIKNISEQPYIAICDALDVLSPQLTHWNNPLVHA